MGTDVKNIIAEINSGYATCPSCKSEEWKSARMVVMENTKHISGSFNGVREPSYSGDFFTSDDWFSKENALSANVNLMSTGGLVGEVYRLMSSFNLITRMPEEPNIPAPNIAAPNIPAPNIPAPIVSGEPVMPVIPKTIGFLTKTIDFLEKISLPEKPPPPLLNLNPLMC